VIASSPAARATAPAAAALAALALAVAVAACAPSASPSPSAPAGSPSPASADASAGPSPTPWPGNVADSVIALGAADSQIAAAGAAMDAAIAAKDLRALKGAVDGLVTYLDEQASAVTDVSGYPATRSLGETYARAFAEMRAGSVAVSDGVKQGDATAVDAGIAGLSAGITTYGLARQALGPLLDQAISQKRLLVK
jgi:hypothetical protein